VNISLHLRNQILCELETAGVIDLGTNENLQQEATQCQLVSSSGTLSFALVSAAQQRLLLWLFDLLRTKQECEDFHLD